MSELNANQSCQLCCDKDEKINQLSKLLEERDERIKHLLSLLQQYEPVPDSVSAVKGPADISNSDLTNYEISRFSRQIILPEIGVRGQKRLKNTSVLIVGAGGLGCPVGLYLAAAGVGTIGIVDYDNVEINNLHRQVLHKEKNVGMCKSESFARSLKEINSSLVSTVYKSTLTSKNAKEIFQPYDVIVDASDNVPTRYLMNDTAVLLQKPLVSGAALRFEGQLTVYNFQGSPCYRCLFPTPSLPETNTNCSDAGVLGAVTGVIGCLQALEAIKIAAGLTSSFANKMLHFDGLSGKLHTFKLRGKTDDCAVCGSSPRIIDLIDYETFCQARATDKTENISVLSDHCRISCSKYWEILANNVSHILLDVRPSYEYDICSLPNSINISFQELQTESGLHQLRTKTKEHYNCEMNYVICRRGNDSQKAVIFLQEHLNDVNAKWNDIKGGLEAWHKEVDSNFPLY